MYTGKEMSMLMMDANKRIQVALFFIIDFVFRHIHVE